MCGYSCSTNCAVPHNACDRTSGACVRQGFTGLKCTQ
ncbi:hypothetical protein RRG08_048714, partial [Elysia crispata]